MMKVFRLLFVFLGFLLFASTGTGAADSFELLDGDRVVLVGNTLIEREQRTGYWETALTRRYPARNITFRNLGWSGDNVFGRARAEFGSAEDGFRELKDHVFALKPTVIVVGYGGNESFAGAKGLPHFLDGLRVLLDMLAQTKARIIVLSPLCHEELGRPLPDPTEHNKNIRLYRDALRAAARERGYAFVDLYGLLGDGTKATPPAPLTDNGIHLTPYGYWRSAAALERGLGLAPLSWQIEVDAGAKIAAVPNQGAKVSGAGISFHVTDARLPPPPPPENSPAGACLPGTERVMRARGLVPGRYALCIDGRRVAAATSAEWAAGISLRRGPEFDQVERLRKAIVEKNLLYFHRWRPQNDTYLFGFRKHEQGQNAKEIPQFDPLVATVEGEIARLRVPVPHTYEFRAEREVHK